MEEKNEFELLENKNYIEVLKDVLIYFMNEATDFTVKVLDSDIVQDGVETITQIGEAVSETVKIF